MVFILPYESKILYIYEVWAQKREQMGWKPMSFYRSRADDEGIEKLTYLTLYSMKYGAVAGIFDGAVVSNATTLRHYLGRIGFWTLPAALSAGSFLATTHVLAKTTGKDNVYNHMLGGVVAASVWGWKFNSYALGFPLALILAALCGVKKLTVDYDMPFIGNVPKYPEYWYFAQKHDLSIMK
uniref:NADH dehydrogenase [ubiquinone] 1 alpha subcomplex subunit 11 n=1 Tax=Hyalomma excavatum TaxID=257692 RepID=A0A131XKP4_9ACAR